jgi:hypothetical protein
VIQSWLCIEACQQKPRILGLVSGLGTLSHAGYPPENFPFSDRNKIFQLTNLTGKCKIVIQFDQRHTCLESSVIKLVHQKLHTFSNENFQFCSSEQLLEKNYQSI